MNDVRTEDWIQAHKNYSGEDCLIWPFSRNNKGYGQITRGNKRPMVNRVMCVLAHGEPPSPQMHAAHSCGNGHLGCANPKHLSWKTASENAMDKVAHGTHSRGERHGRAKLTENDVREIRALKGVEKQKDTAERFGIAVSTVCEINTGRSWAWL